MAWTRGCAAALTAGLALRPPRGRSCGGCGRAMIALAQVHPMASAISISTHEAAGASRAIRQKPIAETAKSWRARVTKESFTDELLWMPEHREVVGCARPAHWPPASLDSATQTVSEHTLADQIHRFAFICQQKEDFHRRRAALARLEMAVASVYPTAKLQVFGSSATGLSLPNSDVDLILCTDDGKGAVRPLKQIRNGLSKLKYLIDEPMLLPRASVPIFKCREIRSGLAVDICANSPAALEITNLMRQDLQCLPALRPVLLVLKCALRQRQMHQTVSGGVGSYLLFLMVREVAIKQQNADVASLLLNFLAKYKGKTQVQIQEPWGMKRLLGENAHQFGSASLSFMEAHKLLQKKNCISALLHGWHSPLDEVHPESSPKAVSTARRRLFGKLRVTKPKRQKKRKK